MKRLTLLPLWLFAILCHPLSIYAQNCTRLVNNTAAFTPDIYDDYGCFMFQLLNDGSPNVWVFDNSSYFTEDTIQKQAILSGEIYQFGHLNRRFAVRFNFKNQRKTLISGTPYGASGPDWYFYDFDGGEMLGEEEMAGARLNISPDASRFITQLGSGATQVGVNGNRFGLLTYFEWTVSSQPNSPNAPKLLSFPNGQNLTKGGSIEILLNKTICDTKPKPLTIACTRAIRNAKFFTPNKDDDYGALMFNLVNDVSPNVWLFDTTATITEDTIQKRAILRGGISQMGHPKRRFDVTLELANRRDVDRPYGFINGTSDDGWYYYDLDNGSMLGTDDFEGAELSLTPDTQRGAFQVGNGATQIEQDSTIYGLHGWFQWVVNAQPTSPLVPRLNGFPGNNAVLDRGSFQVLLSDCFEKCMVYDAKNSIVTHSDSNGYRPYRGIAAKVSAFYLKSNNCTRNNINCKDTFPSGYNFSDPLRCKQENLGENFQIPNGASLKVRVWQGDIVNPFVGRTSRSTLRVSQVEKEPEPVEEPIEAGVGFIKKIANIGFIDVSNLNKNPDFDKSILELLSKNNSSVNKYQWQFYNNIKHNIRYFIDDTLLNKEPFPFSDSACYRFNRNVISDISIRDATLNPYVQIGIGANGYHPDKLGMTVRISYNVSASTGREERNGGINVLLVNPRPCYLDFTENKSKSASLTFNAQAQENRTRLDWVNVKGMSDGEFIVQRLNDAKNFEDISEIKCVGEIGLKYFYNYDDQPTEGDNFYRLKWVGKDALVSYSNIKKVNFPTINTFLVYPNPADEVINLDLRNYKNQSLTIRLYNIIGHEVKVKSIDNQDNTPVQIEVQGLETGYYYLRISAKNKRDAVKKILIAR